MKASYRKLNLTSETLQRLTVSSLFPKLAVYQNHLGSLVTIQCLELTPADSDSVGIEWGLGIVPLSILWWYWCNEPSIFFCFFKHRFIALLRSFSFLKLQSLALCKSFDVTLPCHQILFWLKKSLQDNICSLIEADILTYSFAVVILRFCNVSWTESDETLFLFHWI